MRDLKAEMNLTPAEREQTLRLRTPKTLRVKGASPSLQNLHKKRKKLQCIVDIYKKVWYNKSNGWKSRLWKVEY